MPTFGDDFWLIFARSGARGEEPRGERSASEA